MIRSKSVVIILLQQLLVKQIRTVTIDFSTQFLPQQTNDLITQYPTAQYTGKVQRCRRTIKNCRCLDVWEYQGQSYQSCANPDSDEQGNWCQIQDGCVNEDLTGLLLLQNDSVARYDYCPSFCLDLPYSRKTQQQGLPQDCGVTNKGCRCLDSWSYKSEQNITGCANPDNDSRGPWCIVNPTTCAPNTFIGELINPSGQILNFDYCPPVCDLQQEDAESPIIFQDFAPVSEIPQKIRTAEDSVTPDVEDNALNQIGGEDLQEIMDIQIKQFSIQSPPLMEIFNGGFVSIDLDLDEGRLSFQNQTFFGMFYSIAEPSTEMLQLSLFDVDMLQQIIDQDQFNDTVSSLNFQDILLQVDNLEKYEDVIAPIGDAGIDEIEIEIISEDSSITQKVDIELFDIPKQEDELDTLDVSDIDARSPITPFVEDEFGDELPLEELEIIYLDEDGKDQILQNFYPQPEEELPIQGFQTQSPFKRSEIQEKSDSSNLAPENEAFSLDTYEIIFTLEDAPILEESTKIDPEDVQNQPVIQIPKQEDELDTLFVPNVDAAKSPIAPFIEDEFSSDLPLEEFEIIHIGEDVKDQILQKFYPLSLPEEEFPIQGFQTQPPFQPSDIQEKSDSSNLAPENEAFSLDTYEIIFTLEDFPILEESTKIDTAFPQTEEDVQSITQTPKQEHDLDTLDVPNVDATKSPIAPFVEDAFSSDLPLEEFEIIHIGEDFPQGLEKFYPQPEEELPIQGFQTQSPFKRSEIQEKSGPSNLAPENEAFSLDTYEIIFTLEDAPIPKIEAQPQPEEISPLQSTTTNEINFQPIPETQLFTPEIDSSLLDQFEIFLVKDQVMPPPENEILLQQIDEEVTKQLAPRADTALEQVTQKFEVPLAPIGENLGNIEVVTPSPEVDIFPLDLYEIIHEIDNRTSLQSNISLFQSLEEILPNEASKILEVQQTPRTEREGNFDLDGFVPEIDGVPSDFNEILLAQFQVLLNNPSEELQRLPTPDNENQLESKTRFGNSILENEDFSLHLYEIIYEVDDPADTDNMADTTLFEQFLPPIEDIPMKPATEESENLLAPEIEQESINDLENIVPDTDEFPISDIDLFELEDKISLFGPTQEPKLQIESPNNTGLFGKDPFPNLQSPKISLVQSELDIDLEEQIQILPPSFEEDIDNLDEIFLLQEDQFVIPKVENRFLDEEDTIQGLDQIIPEVEPFPLDIYEIIFASSDDITTPIDQDTPLQDPVQLPEPQIESPNDTIFSAKDPFPNLYSPKISLMQSELDLDEELGLTPMPEPNPENLFRKDPFPTPFQDQNFEIEPILEFEDQPGMEDATRERLATLQVLKIQENETDAMQEIEIVPGIEVLSKEAFPFIYAPKGIASRIQDLDEAIDLFDLVPIEEVIAEIVAEFQDSKSVTIPTINFLISQQLFEDPTIIQTNQEIGDDYNLNTNIVVYDAVIGEGPLEESFVLQLNQDPNDFVQNNDSLPLADQSIALQNQPSPIPSPPPNIEEINNQDSSPPLVQDTKPGIQDYIQLESPPPPASPLILVNEDTASPFPSPKQIILEDDIKQSSLKPKKEEIEFSPPLLPSTLLLQTLQFPPPPSPLSLPVPSAILPSPPPLLLQSPPPPPAKIIRQRYYKQGIPAEFVEKGSICNVSRAGCDCLPFWTYDADGDGRESLFRGCIQTKDARGRAWCPIDLDTCRALPASEGISTKERTAAPWDFCPNRCTLTRRGKCQTTLNECKCRQRWSYEGLMQKGCTRPDGTSAFSWCVVRENCKHAIGFIANSVDGWEWDICDENC